VITGDGDSLSIGGNHLIHVLRRNVGVKILLFNNRIYGLTKGQYSPTSPVGTKKKSTPMGSIDRPFEPAQFALGSQATFVARTIDQDIKHMTKTLEAAKAHRGTSFIEILQNCVIFNKDFYASTVERKVRPDRTIDLQAGEPMVYGAERDKGLRFNGFEVERCSAADAHTWDPTTKSGAPAFLIAGMKDDPEMPLPVGILRNVEAPNYETGVNAQVDEAVAKKGKGDLKDLVYAGEMWTVD
ncbi:MAG: thiamine pyrophosphate-dependent enzyme, partial [Planctomycetota bacterium]